MNNEKKKKQIKSKENLLRQQGRNKTLTVFNNFKDLKNHLNQNNDLTRF